MKRDIFRRVTEFIQSQELLQQRERVIVGVSGGADSVFLLHYLSHIRLSYKLDIIAAHFNHALRPEADAEEDFARELSKQLKVRFVSEKRHVAELYRGNSWENTARALRFDFFLKICRRYKVKKVFLAHHKDDLAETVLLHLIRGSGLLGLRGIMPLSSYRRIFLVRPLLFLNKGEILEYLKNHSIKFMTDQSNEDGRFLRNRVRLELLPLLQEYNPAIKDSLYNLAKTVSADYDLLVSWAEKEFVSLELPAREGVRLRLQNLTKLHPSLLFIVLRIAAMKAKGSLLRLELRHLEKVKGLVLYASRGDAVDIPGLKVIKEEEAVYFLPVRGGFKA